MRKEELLKLGLDEATAQKVAEASAEELKSFIPKSRFDEVNTSKNDYEKQVKDFQKQVDDLTKSAKSTEELQTNMKKLQEDFKIKETEYQAKLKDTALNSAIKLSLSGKVHDADVVSMLIDKKTIEVDDKGNITKGLDEQLKTLKESKSFLFVPEKKEEPKPNPYGFLPRVGGGNDQQPPKDQKPTSIYDMVGQYYSQNH